MGDTHRGFGEALRAGREARGLSQTALAAELGRSQSFVSGLENGRHLPSLTLFGNLVRVLNLEPAGVLAALLPEEEIAA